MLKRSIEYLWSLRTQFAKYFVVGFSGLLLDMATLIMFKEWLHWSAVLAVVINQILLLSYNFLLNKYWSFKNKEMPHRQIVRYLTLAAFNYGFSVIAMYVFHDRFFQFDYRLVRIITIACMVSWNFFLYKHWVYAHGEGVMGYELRK